MKQILFLFPGRNPSSQRHRNQWSFRSCHGSHLLSGRAFLPQKREPGMGVRGNRKGKRRSFSKPLLSLPLALSLSLSLSLSLHSVSLFQVLATLIRWTGLQYPLGKVTIVSAPMPPPVQMQSASGGPGLILLPDKWVTVS